MTQRNGACLCGEVAYRLNSDIKNIVNCHCNFCRSHSGAAFSSYAALPYASLEISSGQTSISIYEVPGGKKHFCAQCGTPIFNLNEEYPGACMIYLGTLDDVSNITPKMNIWYENRLAWVDDINSIHSMNNGIKTR